MEKGIDVPTLGNSSQVRVSKELVNAYGGPLSFKKKQALRQELVISLIKSKPAGTRIKLGEFGSLLNFPKDGNTDNFIKGMMRRGLIGREPITPRTFCYFVLGDKDVNVIVPKKELPTADDEIKATDVDRIPSDYSLESVRRKAVAFSWENPDNNNDLRAFIASLEKELNGKTY